MSEPTYRAGYYTGILDVYYAEMTQEDTTAALPEYDTPAVLGRSIEVTITPNYREGSVYASNVATRKEKRIDSYTVSINADCILQADLAKVLGRTIETSTGIQRVKGSNVSPYVAIGFCLTLDDGSKEYWWLYKGKLSEPTVTGHTDEDTPQYQHPTLEGDFIRRACDDAIAAVLDSESTADDAAATAAAWFTAVYETPEDDDNT